MTLWSTVTQIPHALREEVNLEDMLTIMPLWSESSDPIVLKIIKTINSNLKQYNLFPKIGSTPSANFPLGRLQ